MWHHGAILAFLDRLARDSEFREWYVQSPAEALTSYGLDVRDLHYLEDALRVETAQREVARALSPLAGALRAAAERTGETPSATYERLSAELDGLHERLAAARARERAARPWWKLW